MEDSFRNLAAPARRALASIGVTRLADLESYTEDEIASLHGMGPTAIAQLVDALSEDSLSFKKNAH